MADGWSWYIGGDYDAWKTTPPDEEDETEEEGEDA
jgi:hypothetical protein